MTAGEVEEGMGSRRVASRAPQISFSFSFYCYTNNYLQYGLPHHRDHNNASNDDDDDINASKRGLPCPKTTTNGLETRPRYVLFFFTKFILHLLPNENDNDEDWPPLTGKNTKKGPNDSLI
jgi:hypothetical protein